MLKIFLDLETTGMSRSADDIVQVAACHALETAPGGHSILPGTEPFSAYTYSPLHDSWRYGAGARIHGIPRATVRDALPFPAVWAAFGGWLRALLVTASLHEAPATELVMVAHNGSSFDYPMLESALAKHGLPPLHRAFPGLSTPPVFADSLRLIRRTTSKAAHPKRGLGPLYRSCTGHGIVDAHDALADVRALRTLAEHGLIGARDLRRHADDVAYTGPTVAKAANTITAAFARAPRASKPPRYPDKAVAAVPAVTRTRKVTARKTRSPAKRPTPLHTGICCSACGTTYSPAFSHTCRVNKNP